VECARSLGSRLRGNDVEQGSRLRGNDVEQGARLRGNDVNKAWQRTSSATELFRDRGADVYDFASVFVGVGQDQ
jgi:hypothetical protein